MLIQYFVWLKKGLTCCLSHKTGSKAIFYHHFIVHILLQYDFSSYRYFINNVSMYCTSHNNDALMNENDMQCWLHDTDKGRLCSQRKPYTSVMASTTNPKQSAMGSNLSFCSNKSVISYLNSKLEIIWK